MDINNSDLDSFEFTSQINEYSLIHCSKCKRFFNIQQWQCKEASLIEHNDVIALVCPNGHYHFSFSYAMEVV